jgi:hypothetical protein
MTFRPLIAAAALMFAASASQASQVNLIVNGGFDTSNVAVGSYAYSNGFSAQVVQASPWVFGNGSGIANFSSDWGGAASNGAVAFMQDYVPAGWGAPTLSQQFASNETSLKISFELAARTDHAAEGLLVSLNGLLLTPAALVPLSNALTAYEFIVHGLTGSSHTLSFAGFNASGANDASLFLDNVSVTLVPEPGSLALVLAALLGGAALRRQRQAKV